MRMADCRVLALFTIPGRSIPVTLTRYSRYPGRVLTLLLFTLPGYCVLFSAVEVHGCGGIRRVRGWPGGPARRQGLDVGFGYRHGVIAGIARGWALDPRHDVRGVRGAGGEEAQPLDRRHGGGELRDGEGDRHRPDVGFRGHAD